MDVPDSTFLRLWRNDSIRSNIISHLDVTSICALRLTHIECSQSVTKFLFRRVRLTFTPSSFRQSRVDSLKCIGHYIMHLNFVMPHTPSTFLPPLLSPLTGREFPFLYSPLTSPSSLPLRPKYGCSQLADLLTEQYPPIFHAATNVPSFLAALTQMPRLRQLTISTPNQEPALRYRRSAVDYALISLRIAIERAHLPFLEKLVLKHVHPASLLYLKHSSGFGCTPAAGRRWSQIRRLYITMDSWDFYGPQPGLDLLKLIDDYIRQFSPYLEKVSFGWNGKKGPCPFALRDDALFQPSKEHVKLFAEVTSLMSPLPAHPTRKAMKFPKL